MKKAYMIQAWDSLTNKWCVPVCDASFHEARGVVKRWLTDVVNADQLPLWLLESYARAADEEGETYLRRYRPFMIAIREYDVTDGTISPQGQRVIYQWLVFPTIDREGDRLWQVARVTSGVPADRAYIEACNPKTLITQGFRNREVQWEIIPWEFLPATTQECEAYYGCR